MTPSFCGWGAFSTSGALTHIKITWAFSPMAPQVMVSLQGSLCANDVVGTPRGKVRDKCLLNVNLKIVYNIQCSLSCDILF